MRRALLPFLLGLLGFGLFVTSMAMAASGQPVAAPLSGDSPLFLDPPSSTLAMSPTHPVAIAIANHFSDTFGVTYTDIMSHHVNQGLGFGVIAKAYFISEALSGTGVMPADVIYKFLNEGMGWGEIMKSYGLHPGVAGRGGNLGGIMSNRFDKKGSVLPPGLQKKVDDCWPPGHCKNNGSGDGAGLGPPGLKSSSEDDGDDRGGGRPAVPPGQVGKDKSNNGKGKGNK